MIEQIVTKEDFELFRRLAESRGNLWQQEMAEEALAGDSDSIQRVRALITDRRMGDENKPPKFDPEKLLGTTSVRQYHFANGRERFLLLTETEAKDSIHTAESVGWNVRRLQDGKHVRATTPEEGGIVIDWFFDA